KSPRLIFAEFEDQEAAKSMGRGDVKYHLGYHNDWVTATGRRIHLMLCFNPSHLEFINPVAMGLARAKQDRWGADGRDKSLCVLVHGDASFAGEGIVQESLNLSELAHYSVGGALHIVVNNQIGFTTSPEDGRSSVYATDVARMLQIPIFHVNGEDPEAVAQVVRLAMEYRKTFKRDVVIDMYCYRRYGHNESDEPAFTQPLLYRAIEKRKSVREGYLERLLAMNEITRDEADAIVQSRRRDLEDELSAARRKEVVNPHRPSVLGQLWQNYRGGPEDPSDEADTRYDHECLAFLLDAQTRLPDDFHPHPKISRFLEQRREMARGARPLDWTAAESLAFATLACERVRVRLSGQDSERGTFSQRHAVLHDVEDGHAYVPLQCLCEGQAPVEIRNSPLSEAGVLGFEYGYSSACPDGLILWEAQFGDFANAAQVYIDQFIASGEEKWNRLNGLVLLLPHGFEGQGPDHSNARLERFLSLAAEDNIQIVNPTTPAQYFHCLRRQALRKWRKPLIALTPKSLLRHPGAVSTLDDLARGEFQRVIPDERPAGAASIRRILLCSGKIYYELAQRREETKRTDVAIVRVEQLYPLPAAALEKALPYAEGTSAAWVQEEPENMGAWRDLRARFGERLLDRFPFSCVSRPAAGSPATGSHGAHRMEQEELLRKAFHLSEQEGRESRL
ncbi:MAG: 2-oxoglutarate dehydrogenase E1 component, partial [Candidatus Sumerlaeota bacterium]|nr:2-oxoglutarate dehydrogenase E1 component [Candidatus Sumerlaeota bacterium]